jgi:hypothetical protein
MRICTCTSWTDNIDKVLFPCIFLSQDRPQMYEGYLGELFRYCPWCGEKLVSVKEDVGDVDSVMRNERVI